MWNFMEYISGMKGFGGLFDVTEEPMALAFQNAIERINNERAIARQSQLRNMTFMIPLHDSFAASRKLCEMTKTGIAAVFGPNSRTSATHVQNMCDGLGIPHVETRWDHRSSREELSVNLHPHPEVLGKAFRDILEILDWHKFTILYSDNEGLYRLQEILKVKPPQNKELKLTIRQLVLDGDNRPLLKALKKSGETHIVLDCHVDKIYEIMKQAKEVGMLTEYHNYFFTNLDFHAVDLRDLFRDSGANITGVSIVDIESKFGEYLSAGGGSWTLGMERTSPSSPGYFTGVVHPVDYMFHQTATPLQLARMETARISPKAVMTSIALIHDAVSLFGAALIKLDDELLDGVIVKQMQCHQGATWNEGRNLIWIMKMLTIEGLSGTVRLDAQGYRRDFNLDILEVGKKGLEKVGRWEKGRGANYTRLWTDREAAIRQELKDKNLIITMIENAPYVMYKKNKDEFTGNDQFEGFCIDLIKGIAEKLHFNYTFRPVKDSSYGSRDKITGEWNGMIRELLDREADLAAADLTISHEREEAVDFTMPFMNLGIGILYKKPAKKPPNLFSFLSPLSLDVWIYMATAYMGVSILIFALARFTPHEWVSSHPCKPDPDELENSLTLSNSLWHVWASLMQQGCDIAPKAVSTRMVAGMWWFFTLIMISSYTANLAAYLTVERMEAVISGPEELSKQTKIKYGSLGTGSTKVFFRDSKIETYQRMWSVMESTRPTVFTKTNQEGVDRVRSGGYAYIMESTTLEYMMEKYCDLIQVGGLLDSKGYGLALPPGSPYTSAVSSAILKLQEDGEFFNLKSKWWKERNEGAGKCHTETAKVRSSSSANELSLANVGGVFVVLMGGVGIAILLAFCEFFWKSRKLAIEENASLCQEMGRELGFALKCRGSTKPVPSHIKAGLSAASLNESGTGPGSRSRGTTVGASLRSDPRFKQRVSSPTSDSPKTGPTHITAVSIKK
ncbi:unnamed protein product [Notodromas monacha]|uniref:Glutamate receptor 1 n=1 Tax=Notodromas monacha TaxID=399045 RepID=A0A7R9GD52_9CRUS|nr:unnamed protein product [Notodromas monacha]CAG0916801.1 unnamed protein product [Notodromas monacha]